MKFSSLFKGSKSIDVKKKKKVKKHPTHGDTHGDHKLSSAF